MSSGAMNSGVPQGSAGWWKNTARLKSITLTGASGALQRTASSAEPEVRRLRFWTGAAEKVMD